MSDETLLFFSEVQDREGVIGQFTRAVLRLGTWELDFIVVSPDDVAIAARLVPVKLVQHRSSESILLDCARREFLDLEAAVEYETSTPSPRSIGLTTAVNLSSSGISVPAISMTGAYAVTPDGCVGIDHGRPVVATDGNLGHAVGLGVELWLTSRVTSIVIGQGHLWTRRRLAIPIAVVASITDEVRINVDVQRATALATDS